MHVDVVLYNKIQDLLYCTNQKSYILKKKSGFSISTRILYRIVRLFYWLVVGFLTPSCKTLCFIYFIWLSSIVCLLEYTGLSTVYLKTMCTANKRSRAASAIALVKDNTRASIIYSMSLVSNNCLLFSHRFFCIISYIYMWSTISKKWW